MMKSVALKLFILSMLAIASATPMWNEENDDYNDGAEESGEENNDEVANYNYPRPPTYPRPVYNPWAGNYPRPPTNPRPAYNQGPANYPRPYDFDGGFRSNDDNSQIDGFEGGEGGEEGEGGEGGEGGEEGEGGEGGEEENDNDEGGNTFARDEGFSRGYPSNRQSGSDYRSLKRKPNVRIRTSNSRTRLRSRDYDSGSEEVSNFGNGDHNRHVFHITKKIIYV